MDAETLTHIFSEALRSIPPPVVQIAAPPSQPKISVKLPVFSKARDGKEDFLQFLGRFGRGLDISILISLEVCSVPFRVKMLRPRPNLPRNCNIRYFSYQKK